MYQIYVSIWVAAFNCTWKKPRLLVRFDKVNNGSTYIVLSGSKFIFAIYKRPHTLQSKGEVGYVVKLATHKKFEPCN